MIRCKNVPSNCVICLNSYFWRKRISLTPGCKSKEKSLIAIHILLNRKLKVPINSFIILPLLRTDGNQGLQYPLIAFLTRRLNWGSPTKT